MVALALYRPGPAPQAASKTLSSSAGYLGLGAHPVIPPGSGSCSWGDTYGVILYQEQVLRIAHDLAGLSLAEASSFGSGLPTSDSLTPGRQSRRSKRNLWPGPSPIRKRRSRRASPASACSGELMAAFAGYGFPKAHAASLPRRWPGGARRGARRTIPG